MSAKQDEITTVNTDLESKVNERTQQIKERNSELLNEINERKDTEAKLIEAKEKAEESDQLKTAFLQNVSHEIRTPMNGILGFSNLLSTPGISGQERKKYLNIIQKSGIRMISTLNDLMDISMLETGQLVPHFEETNINSEFEGLLSFFKPLATKKGLKLINNNEFNTEELIIYTDRDKILAIFSNLIKNSIKYTYVGQIEIGYNLIHDIVDFYVIDTGIGVPTNRYKAIFDRFVQGDIEDKNVYEGSGLGLTISKAYVEMLGGEISLKSIEGKGSEFHFTIPTNPNNENSSNQQNNEKHLPSSLDSIHELNILIADDEDIANQYLSIILKDICPNPILVGTGIEAIDICKKNPELDLILMDIKMPKMNGHEATRQIREFNKDVIIIAQTAYALAGDSEKAIESGCNDYISKPIDAHLLRDMIHRLTNDNTTK